VNYELAFSDKALAGLKRLETWLQEETLDELERIAAHPPEPSPSIGRGGDL
jgi:hypothetical protein